MCDTEETRALDSAAEHLYETYAGYPLRHRIPGCADCVDTAMEAPLHSKPLRLLTADDLNFYAAKAMTAWGELGLQALLATPT
jgi:hypothetical protein